MMTFLLIFLVIIGMFYFLLWKNKTTVKQTTFRFSRKLHFTFIIGYVVFLLAVLITSEFVEQQQPLSSADELKESDFMALDNTLSNGDFKDVIDSSLLLEKRSHPAGKTLDIQNPYGRAFIYLERKNSNDGIIEEFIFQPMLSVNEQNFSNKVNVSKPIWKNDTMTFPVHPVSEIQHVMFHDAILLNQMTKSNFHGSSFGSSFSGSFFIYLVVPEDVEIETVSEEYIEYIE